MDDDFLASTSLLTPEFSEIALSQPSNTTQAREVGRFDFSEMTLETRLPRDGFSSLLNLQLYRMDLNITNNRGSHNIRCAAIWGGIF